MTPDFEETVSFQGDPRRALDMAGDVVVQDGFEWLPMEGNAFEAYAPGCPLGFSYSP